MGDICIGAKISAKRRKKGITQEELARFLGVSKPAVSKWESGQSYPDITLLPVIAAYFNMTVDELLGYEPQMTKEDVQKMYVSLCQSFASEPFDAAYAKCQEYEKKYFSCWAVQFHIGVLYINHVELAKDKISVIKEAIWLFERVAKESDDVSLARQAICMQSYGYLALSQPADAIDLLENMDDIAMSCHVLLVKAYQMKGDIKKAKSLLQGYIYTQLIGIVGILPDFLSLYADEPLKAKEGLDKIIAMGNVFDLETIHPTMYVTAYLAAAQIHAMKGRIKEAIDMLNEYVRILSTPGLFPLKLKGNEFFDLLEDFLGSLDLSTFPPRSNEVIRHSAREAVLSNPVFELLKSDPKFLQLVKKLDKI
ncbi:MAG: helix-turn-helix transcriptional regulator [Eubacteriales bacterium]